MSMVKIPHAKQHPLWDIAHMEENPLFTRIKSRLDKLNLSSNAASEKAGLDRTFIKQIEYGKKKGMRSDSASRLARVLQCDVGWLMSGEGDSPPTLADSSETVHPNAKMPPSSVDFVVGPRDLPIRGNARGGADAFFLDNGDIQGMAYRPGALVGVKNAFACYMTGDSMEPRYESGDLLYVNPIKPIRPRDYVLLELDDHQAYVKRLVRRTADKIIVEQFNPKKEIHYDAGRILHIYRVVGQITE